MNGKGNVCEKHTVDELCYYIVSKKTRPLR